MSATGSGLVFDVAQIAEAPELTADFIGLSAILEEFTREAPVSVVFQPGSETVFVADFTETRYIFVGHLVGYQATEVPKEAVCHFRTSHDNTVQCRDVGSRVVAVCFLEVFQHGVCPVLATGFIAVFHDDAESLAVLGRDTLHYLSDVIVEMGTNVFLAHLVRFQSGAFLRCRTVDYTGRKHSCTGNDPSTFRNIPGERTV